MIEHTKSRFAELLRTHETKATIAVFLGGFILDIVTLAEIDDLFAITQQIVYLAGIGFILSFELLESVGSVTIRHPRLRSAWKYRGLAVHFLLGSLLSIYSLFFLKSSSLFSTGVFVLVLIGLLVANELKRVQASGVDLKIGLYVVCLFSFFSILFPILLGFVGLLPFSLALIATAAALYLIYLALSKRIDDKKHLLRRLIAPGLATILLFSAFYIVGWIPPVPLSVEDLGIYHSIEKREGQYLLSHERPAWKIWQNGDQDFLAEPGDKIYVFTRIFSPARFSDSIVVHWMHKNPRTGWQSTDRIPMQIQGGRKGGYRGFAVKQNFSEGSWRVSIETTDGREIGRMYFDVTKTNHVNLDRKFKTEMR